MATQIAIAVAVVAFCMLVTYFVARSSGYRDGFRDGREEGKRVGSIKAFAVGYDRGKRDGQLDHDEPDDERHNSGCFAMLFLLLTVSATLLMLSIASVV